MLNPSITEPTKHTKIKEEMDKKRRDSPNTPTICNPEYRGEKRRFNQTGRGNDNPWSEQRMQKEIKRQRTLVK